MDASKYKDNFLFMLFNATVLDVAIVFDNSNLA